MFLNILVKMREVAFSPCVVFLRLLTAHKPSWACAKQQCTHNALQRPAQNNEEAQFVRQKLRSSAVREKKTLIDQYIPIAQAHRAVSKKVLLSVWGSLVAILEHFSSIENPDNYRIVVHLSGFWMVCVAGIRIIEYSEYFDQSECRTGLIYDFRFDGSVDERILNEWSKFCVFS